MKRSSGLCFTIRRATLPTRRSVWLNRLPCWVTECTCLTCCHMGKVNTSHHTAAIRKVIWHACTGVMWKKSGFMISAMPIKRGMVLPPM